MRKFERDGKVNFIDENNAFVGYDLQQCCCEHAGWFFAPDVTSGDGGQGIPDPDDETLARLRFDPDFFKEIHNDTSLDAGAMVVFRLIGGETVLYLHIYNCHNGYYGHGFTANVGGLDRNGYL